MTEHALLDEYSVFALVRALQLFFCKWRQSQCAAAKRAVWIINILVTFGKSLKNFKIDTLPPCIINTTILLSRSS